MSKTIVITGAAGFIGSTYVRQALQRGEKVIVYDALTYAGHRDNLSEVAGSIEFVHADICDSEAFKKVLAQWKPDAVLNFAAESHVDRSITGPQAFIQTNVVGVSVLLSATLNFWKDLPEAKKSTFRFLQVSTDEVYGSLGPTGHFTEASPLAPNSPYSASKASGDLLVRAWHHTFGLPTVTTNCSNNYGPRQYPEKLIPHMIQSALTGKNLPVYGDGKNVRDWIHVEDHCEGIALALSKGKVGETYCFGGRAEKSNIDVVQTICDSLDQLSPRADRKPHRTAITYVTDRLGHDRRYAIDDQRAESELGFKRKNDFENGLKKTIAWYLENKAWMKSVLARSH